MMTTTTTTTGTITTTIARGQDTTGSQKKPSSTPREERGPGVEVLGERVVAVEPFPPPTVPSPARLDRYHRHLHQLEGGLPVPQGLGQVEDLSDK